jgi:tRNA A-37 threonylcarbamoyl transferase component Bud32
VLGLGLPGESAADVTAPLASRFALPTNEELVSLFPSLEILGLVGQGGMGAVYKARQPHLDRIVALKLLPPEVGRDPTFAERFAREARTLARLSHNNIVHIHDSGQAGGLFYFIMEFIDGVNLRQAMLAGQITPEKALAIVPQICDALQYAHEEGVIHRDIKPENVLLDKRGRIKVADFGLAKLVGNTPADFTLTGTSQAMGTLHYMAPEQMDQPQSVDHRADIYSLGVVFYELLTGRLPLGRFALPSEKLQIDIRLDEVVLKTLEREPERRYQHVSEVTTDMEMISRSPAPPQRATAVFGPPPRPAAATAARMGSPATAMLVFGLLILAGTIALFLCGGVYALLGHVSFALLPVVLAAAVGVATAICLIAVGLTLARQSSSAERDARAALSPEEYETAKRRVRGPALAMLLVALLNCLPLIVVFLNDGDAVLFSEPTWFIMFTAVPVVVTSCLVIFGAICMRDLRWYGLAVAASILVFAPCHYAFALGIPVGIWALVVLTRADTRQAFQMQAGRITAAADGKPGSPLAAQPAWTPVPLVALCAATPLMLIAALIMVRLTLRYTAEDSPPENKTGSFYPQSTKSEVTSKPRLKPLPGDRPARN